jgi:hypothetical protein
MRRSSHRVRAQLRRTSFFLLLVACGSRTGLFVDDAGLAGNPSGSATGSAGGDAGPDAFEDGAIPLLDARPATDVNRTDCPDAEALLVYTITDTNNLQSFNPDTNQFKDIGRIACPTDAPEDTPFSMAVDRKGIAYILFRDEHLYRVSTATGACIRTAYVPRQSNFALFGMGFATNANGPTETLYVAGDDNQGGAHNQKLGARGLARIAPDTFTLSFVNDFAAVNQPELTGTGDGRLYAFYKKTVRGGPPSFIGEIDTDTAAVVGERRFDTVDQGNAWAFAFWGGDFYMFHAPNGGGSHVTRWRPSDDSVTEVATTPLKIVGAGVSTCAPQQ